jgi:imidazolonepropionase-like amidohydrolase
VVHAGIHTIEHGIYLDDETIQLMIEKGIYLVPTLLAPVSVVEAGKANESMPEYAVKKAGEIVEAHKESIAKSYKAGVKIAMGTDDRIGTLESGKLADVIIVKTIPIEDIRCLEHTDRPQG